VTDGPREIMTLPCPTCGGDGIVVSDETNAVNVERELRRLVLTSRHQAYLIELNSRVASILIGPGASRLVELERETGRRFFFETKDELHADHFAVLDRGPVSRLEAKSLPVAAGDELEVKLEAAHLQAEGDAIARLDGYVIAVAGAAGKIGKKVRVRIERPTRTVAYATLAGAAEVEAPVEAGTELDREDTGEQPKRSRRGGSRSRGKPAQAAKAEKPAQLAKAEKPAEEPEAPAAETPAEGDAAPGQPKRKKTRRGSRGGRGRKRKTAAAAAAAANGDQAQPEVAAAQPEPVAEQAAGNGAPPEGGEAAPEQPKRKKTRRGSRGGRNRRKKTPAAAAGEEASGEAATAVAEPGEARLD
jgi:predicted RNA-binding protein with TRAM domain